MEFHAKHLQHIFLRLVCSQTLVFRGSRSRKSSVIIRSDTTTELNLTGTAAERKRGGWDREGDRDRERDRTCSGNGTGSSRSVPVLPAPVLPAPVPLSSPPVFRVRYPSPSSSLSLSSCSCSVYVPVKMASGNLGKQINLISSNQRTCWIYLESFSFPMLLWCRKILKCFRSFFIILIKKQRNYLPESFCAAKVDKYCATVPRLAHPFAAICSIFLQRPWLCCTQVALAVSLPFFIGS